MSKAEEKSKQYKDFREQCGIKDPVMLDEIEEAYYGGYHQAEKDLELTWEDVSKIRQIMFDYNRQLMPEIVENKETDEADTASDEGDHHRVLFKSFDSVWNKPAADNQKNANGRDDPLNDV